MWARNPNRDIGCRPVEAAGGATGAVRHLRRGDHPLRPRRRQLHVRWSTERSWVS